MWGKENEIIYTDPRLKNLNFKGGKNNTVFLETDISLKKELLLENGRVKLNPGFKLTVGSDN